MSVWKSLAIFFQNNLEKVRLGFCRAKKAHFVFFTRWVCVSERLKSHLKALKVNDGTCVSFLAQGTDPARGLGSTESRGEAFCWRTKEQQEEVPLRLEAAPLSDGFFMFAPASEETARSERLRAVTARCQT